ncbi:hypothetical protein [Bartonella apis]|nr:hypothetical protein [Bartonella apis]
MPKIFIANIFLKRETTPSGRICPLYLLFLKECGYFQRSVLFIDQYVH